MCRTNFYIPLQLYCIQRAARSGIRQGQTILAPLRRKRFHINVDCRREIDMKSNAGTPQKATKPSAKKADLKRPVKKEVKLNMRSMEGINLGNHNQTLLGG